MPAADMPGDLFTPRMHWGASGASERMVVSPGREQEGIMHMPTGQSGHPLSPFYANSHDAWVERRADAVPARTDGAHADAGPVGLRASVYGLQSGGAALQFRPGLATGRQLPDRRP